MPLVAIEMSLTGPNAAGYELEVEALFLGAAIASQSGASLSLTGPSAREPLVGLRFNVSQKRAQHLLSDPVPPRSCQGKLPGRCGSTVRRSSPGVP